MGLLPWKRPHKKHLTKKETPLWRYASPILIISVPRYLWVKHVVMLSMSLFLFSLKTCSRSIPSENFWRKTIKIEYHNSVLLLFFNTFLTSTHSWMKSLCCCCQPQGTIKTIDLSKHSIHSCQPWGQSTSPLDLSKHRIHSRQPWGTIKISSYH